MHRPVVGFFGGLDDHTSDIALVTEAARRATDMTFVFVGSVSADVSGLRALPNVQLLGQRPYEQIPHYGKCFDVAIMPWRQNRWIQACNPIKLKEYLAVGEARGQHALPRARTVRRPHLPGDGPEQLRGSHPPGPR